MRTTTSSVGLVGLLCASVFAPACTGTIAEGDLDDPIDPAASSEVQITVRDGSSPQANVRVLFQNADDTLVAEVVTDATGRASAEMPDGGNLTVIRTFPPDGAERRPAEVYTYVGVKAGDRLQLGHQIGDGIPSAINVTVPEEANGTIRIVTPCGGGEGTGPIVAITVIDCPAQVAFYVTDGNNSSFFKHAPYSENVDLSTEPLQGSLSGTASATNVPPDTTVNVEQRLVAGLFELYSSGTKRVDAQPATVTLPNIQGVDQLVVSTIRANNRTQQVARREAYAGSPVIVDASAGLIPTVSEPATFSPTGISWAEEGPGLAELVLVTLDVTRGAAEGTPALDAEYVRAIIAPHTGPSLRLPMLPGADAIYNVTEADEYAGTHGIAAVTGGYDAARATAFAVPSLVDATPSAGMITLSYAGTAPGL